VTSSPPLTRRSENDRTGLECRTPRRDPLALSSMLEQAIKLAGRSALMCNSATMQRSSSSGARKVRDQLPSFFQIHSKNGQLGVVPLDGQHIVTVISILFQNCDDSPIWDSQDVARISVLCHRTGCSSETKTVSNHSITSFPDFRRGG